ncbi:MAG: GntR family transcriptional regulator [Paracoccaceae bacterium]
MTAEVQGQTAIRRSDSAPAYLQLADILEDRIAALDDAARRRPLSSESELSREFGLSRISVRQAIKRLESKGLVYSEQGKGSFPTIPRVKGISGFHSFTNEVLRNGQRPGSTVLFSGLVERLPADMQDKLNVPVAECADHFLLRRVRLIDDTPVALEDAYLPVATYPGIAPELFGTASLYDVIGRRWGHEPGWTDAIMEPARASAAVANLFSIDEGDPVLVAWRVTLTASDQLIERVRSIYRPGFNLRVARYRLG